MSVTVGYMKRTFARPPVHILDSSVWQQDAETRIVWITLLAMADRNGLVDAALPGVANRARVSVEKTKSAIELLMKPDRFSEIAACDGRRIAKNQRGWEILGWEGYQDVIDSESRRAYQRASQARYRAKARLKTAEG